MTLREMISDVCLRWGLPQDDKIYGLKFDKSNEFVTEASVKNIKWVVIFQQSMSLRLTIALTFVSSNAELLRLCHSAEKTAKDIIEKINSSEEVT